MKRKQVLVSLFLLVSLVACNKNNDPTTSTTPLGPGSTPTTTVPSVNPLEEALSKDYSNVTVISYQQYNGGESSETDYQYYVDGMIANYSYDLAYNGYDNEDCYTFYSIDENGESWTYFETDPMVENSKGGWLQKGLGNNDLSIWNIYFYLPLFIESIDPADVGYSMGQYYIKSAEKVEELNMGAFGYAWFNDILDIAFILDENNYINKIFGFCDEDPTKTENYVALELMNIGETSIPVTCPPALSEETKTTYWQYKGWPHDYQQAYYTDIDLSVSEGQDVESDSEHDVVATVDDKFLLEYKMTPEQFEAWDLVDEAHREIVWHYDETVVSMDFGPTSNKKEIHAIGEGETEIYATVQGENGIVESQHIKVKVNALPTQDKTDAVYEFGFAFIDNGVVSAVNKTPGSKSLFDITAGPGVDIIEGKNSDLFSADKSHVVINPSDQDVLNKDVDPGLYFNFGDQQVSKLSFQYGFFYYAHALNTNYLSSFKVRTSNDGVNWEEIDLTAEIKENISPDFLKVCEVEFAPANQVQIVLKASMIGKALGVGLDEVTFCANEECKDYIDPSDVIHVESVTISPSDVSLYIGESQNFMAVVAPQNATYKDVTWHVEEGKESVATFKDGKLTAVGEGSVKVWATAEDGSVKSNEVTVTVSPKPSLTEFAGEYVGEYVEVSVTGEYNATVTYGSNVVDAEVVDFDDEDEKYILENSNGEGFELSFGRDDVTVTKLTYLSNDGLYTSTGTYYADKQIYMTSFGVKVGSLSANSDGKYEVQEGDTVYLTINNVKPSDANVIDVTLSSSDESIATVDNDTESVSKPVTFVGDGEVTITVSANHDSSVSKDVVFVVAAKTYPNESNWSISADAESVNVNSTLQINANFDSSINTDKKVTWSVNDKNLASINSSGVLTGKKAGIVVVTATVKGENGNVSKTLSIEVIDNSSSEAVPGVVQGTWTGCDDNGIEFTLVINSDGTATLTNEYYEWTFTFDHEQNGEYFFVLDGGSAEIGMYNATSDSAQMYVYDDNFELNDYSMFAVYGDYLDVSK